MYIMVLRHLDMVNSRKSFFVCAFWAPISSDGMMSPPGLSSRTRGLSPDLSRHDSQKYRYNICTFVFCSIVTFFLILASFHLLNPYWDLSLESFVSDINLHQVCSNSIYVHLSVSDQGLAIVCYLNIVLLNSEHGTVNAIQGLRYD